jgi:transposase
MYILNTSIGTGNMAYDLSEVTDGVTAGIEQRRQRGLEIAALAKIEKVDGFYLVPSVTAPAPRKYKVNVDGLHLTCNCLDHETRGCVCKHIYAVQFMLRREHHADGSTTVTESVTITKTRKTYAQDWPAYNKAQQNEKREFQILLVDLCKRLDKLPAVERKGPQGRKPLPLSDAVFCAVFKVYSTISARRFTSDLCEAHDKGYIGKVPHFNSVLNYLENPALFPILTNMIEQSALPLKSIESNFAVDSTGFAFSRFVRWYDIKYNRFTSEQQWVKAHICTGVKTNVVTAVEIFGRDTNDSPLLPSLVNTTAANGFTMREVSADKGYTGRENHDAIARVGADPYIMFKSNTTGGVGGLFEKAWHFFCYHRETFLAHYHQRSNVESTVMMVKSKFGDSVRSKTDVAAKNEVLAKMLCHNLCCLVSAMYELGITPDFRLAG